MNNLGVYQFIRNATKYDYPLEESILSAIPIADQIVLCECESEDDTLDRVNALKEKFPDKIQVIHHPWITHFSELSTIGNYCIPHLSTNWHMQLQADEVLEDYAEDTIRYLINNLTGYYNAISVQYYHFLGNYETEFDFIYRKAIRIARRGSGWWLGGDACQLEGGNDQNVFDSKVTLFHYGKVKDGKVGYQKEVDFQSYYTDIGFPDPKMAEMKEKLGEYCDYVYLFEEAIKKGEVRKFEGKHPKVMEERIKKFKDGGYEQFLSKMKEGLKTL